MITKFRAWDKVNERIVEVSEINFWTKVIDTTDTFLAFSNVELLQSTGLKDKNGTEIYIGDILKWQGTMGHGWFEDVQDEVIYDKQELRFKFKNRNENIKNIANISVVAGNRFEHPHLLGED